MIDQNYVSVLEYMTESPLMLYDRKVKASWWVSMISAILHMMHLRAWRRRELVPIHGCTIGIPFTKVFPEVAQVARRAIFEIGNSLLELNDVPGDIAYKLEDIVVRICRYLEPVMESLEAQKPDRLSH